MTLAKGTLLGRYEILSPIGAGGMGEVYRARDGELNRHVAVKILPQAVADDPERLDRFKREACAVARVSHPNILEIFDFGTDQGVSYAVTELLEGETLRESIGSSGIGWRKALENAALLADGLAFAHSNQIIHRDLKPENIFITGDKRLKILDFGLARMARPPDGEAGSAAPTYFQTEAGVVMGTIGYMAPEQLRGEVVDHRSDIFAVGCVLYEMITGRRAFAKSSQVEVMAAILNEQPPALTTTGLTVPKALEELISSCLQKQPDRRISSASELASALQSIATAPQVTAPQVIQPVGQAQPVARRRRAPWFAVVAALLVGAAATMFVIGSRNGSQVVEQPASVQSDRLVVIPFENRTGDAGFDSMGLMAADWVTQGLAQAGFAEVAPLSAARQAVKRYTQEGADSDLLLTVSQATNAAIVISGSYYKPDEQLRFQVNVTNVSSGQLLFALEPEPGHPDAPMDLVEGIRQQVLGAMAIHFKSDSFGISSAMSHIPLYEAFLEYTVGKEQWGKDMREATLRFRRAAELDPDFLAPRIWLIVIYASSGINEPAAEIIKRLEDNIDRLTPYERAWIAWSKAKLHGQPLAGLAALRQAERMAPNDLFVKAMIGAWAIQANRLEEAIDALAYVDFESWVDHPLFERLYFRLASAHHLLGDYQEELAIARQSLELIPHLEKLHENELRALAAIGALEEIDRIIEQCLTGQDRSVSAGWIIRSTALELRAHGHRDASLRLAARAITWYQDRPPELAKQEGYRIALGKTLYLAETWPQALTVFEELERDYPDDPEYVGLVGCAAARLGDRQRALSVSSRLELLRQPYLNGRQTYYRARIAAVLGDQEQAVELLREAIDQGQPYGLYLHRDIDLEGLADFPPFLGLMRPRD